MKCVPNLNLFHNISGDLTADSIKAVWCYLPLGKNSIPGYVLRVYFHGTSLLNASNLVNSRFCTELQKLGTVR